MANVDNSAVAEKIISNAIEKCQERQNCCQFFLFFFDEVELEIECECGNDDSEDD